MAKFSESIPRYINYFPFIRKIIKFYNKYRAIRENRLWSPPGAYYSPIPNIKEIKKDESRIFGNLPVALAGIDLHIDDQYDLLKKFVEYYKELPDWESNLDKSLRYTFNNSEYKYCDAIFLYCMIRHLQPRRIIEIGSGFSSCVMLDTNELFFNNEIITTFIDPYPQRLMSHIKNTDIERVKILQSRVQDVDLCVFSLLQSNDILFVDSSHISKTNSDVNHILFNILPNIAPGVFIHFHDIFYPFEYPKKWVYEGRAWNETYFLRAFLTFNNEFCVTLMNTYLEHFYESFIRESMPLCFKARGGSIWLRKA